MPYNQDQSPSNDVPYNQELYLITDISLSSKLLYNSKEMYSSFGILNKNSIRKNLMKDIEIININLK